MLGRSAAAAEADSAVTSTVWPSAGCLRTSAAAMVVIAPGLLSTMTRQCSVSASSVAMTRLTMSGGLPVPALTKRLGPGGSGWTLGVGGAMIAPAGDIK